MANGVGLDKATGQNQVSIIGNDIKEGDAIGNIGTVCQGMDIK